MRDISLHVLDIAENSVNSGAKNIIINISEDTGKDLFELIIEDDGKGIDLSLKENDPFYTEKKNKRFGLGLPLLEQAASECEGSLDIGRSQKGKGTVVSARFRRSHIDLKPLGDMGSTMAALIGGHPEIEYIFRYRKDGTEYKLNTAEIKKELDGVPVNVPSVLKLIREDVNEGIGRRKR